jgi:hypothetical protein
MAKQVMKFINAEDEELTLSWIKEIQGLGIPPMDLTTARGFRQDGHIVQYVQYQARPFTISFDIREDTYLLAAAERRRIIAFFGDKQPKTFSYTRGGVEYLLEDVYLVGSFDTGIREQRQLEGVLQFIAGDPFFKVEHAASTLTNETAMLEWPVDYLEAGIEYSNTDAANTDITYAGDVPGPLTVRFLGPVTNPWVENITTGEKMEVTKAINAGETLEITSGYANKRVEIILPSGVRQNAFHYIASGSSFLTLEPGSNEIEYGSESGAVSSTVEIEYADLYVGI